MSPSAVARPNEIKISLTKLEKRLWLLALVVSLLGFADLWRGGITFSAFALALAYCVLVPAAIWTGGHEDGRPGADAAWNDSVAYRAAAITSLGVLALYLVTMAPSTAMWDTSEYIAAAYTFGLPHPPGNPFFVIVGRVFSVLPVAATVAARINVLAAVCSAVAAGLWFLTTERILRSWLPATPLRLAGAAAAAILGATAFTVWNQSVVNEKVYTVSLTGIALTSWLAMRWSADPKGAKADRMLVMAAYLCGLGYANHMAGMLPAPAVLLAVLLRRPATFMRWRLMLACVGVVVIGMTPFATQPIRAAHFPPINEGEPTACRREITVSCTLSRKTYDAFMYNFNRGQYAKPALADRQASFGEQLGMWWLYFKWQWLRDPAGQAPFAQSLLAALFLVLGLAGGWVHFRQDRKTFWYFAALMFTTTILLIYYLNFKLGASQDPASIRDHEVRDRDYFFLWSFSSWGVWVALGLVHVWQILASTFVETNNRGGNTSRAEPTGRGWKVAAPTLLLAAVPLITNWRAASRAHHRTTRNVAVDLLNSVEPYGVLVTVGDNDTFPLWYAQEVEGVRQDVVVAITSLMNTDWLARQMIRNPVREYDATSGPAVYRGHHWRKPDRPPLHMTLDEADAVPPYIELPGPSVFSAGPYRATLDPHNLPQGVLERADALVLRIIQDSWADRPIYFSRSAGNYPATLGLGNNVLTQGIASKLFVPPAQPSRDTVAIPGQGWIDVPRTRALWDSVFTGHRSTIAEGRWIDRPSASMPLLYVFTGAELAAALRSRGENQAAQSVTAMSARVAGAAGFDDVAAALTQPLANALSGSDSSGVAMRLNPAATPKADVVEPTVPRTKP